MFRMKEEYIGYLMVVPVILCLFVLVVYPLLFAIWISLTDRFIGSSGSFIGVENYINLLHQPRFQATVRNTVILIGSVQTLKFAFGMGIALLLNQRIRARSFWRAVVLLPWSIPPFVTFITWRLLYAPLGGAYNTILLETGIIGSHIDFLGTRALAMPSVIIATVWSGFPFWAILFFTAMQNVPKELYEAAALDGVNAWQSFLYITLPSIRNTILIVSLISTIWTMNDFENVWLLTQGGPSDSTMIFPVFAFFSLKTMHIGESAAASMFLLPFFIIMSLAVVKHLQDNQDF